MADPGENDESRTHRLRRVDGAIGGVFALTGVVIGAFITAGLTYLGDRNNGRSVGTCEPLKVASVSSSKQVRDEDSSSVVGINFTG